MPHDAFISYSSDDKEIADAVCASLEKSGLACWIAPRDALAGIPYAEALEEALTGSRAVVLLLSAKSNESVHVMREVEAAVNGKIPIVPVRIAEVQPARSLAYFLKSIHWLDAFAPPLERHLPTITKSVRDVLQRQQSGAQPVAPPLPGIRAQAAPRVAFPYKPSLGRWLLIGEGGLLAVAAAIFALVQIWGAGTPETSSKLALPDPASASEIAKVDLLPLVDLGRDRRSGTWRWIGTGRLRGTAHKDDNSILAIPHEPPEEYRLRFTVTRLPPPSGTLHIGLASGKERFNLVFDAHYDDKYFTGINNINGSPVGKRADSRRGRVLRSAVAMQFAITVSKDTVSADVNGQNVYFWQGDFSQGQLRRHRGQSNEPLQLGISDGGDFIFENVTIEALPPGERESKLGKQTKSQD